MKFLILLIIAIASASCLYKEQKDQARFLINRYGFGLNNQDWADFGATVTNDVKLGGANGPLFQNRTQFVDAFVAVTGATHVQIGFHGEKISLDEKYGTLTGYYTFYFPGTEHRIDELGYYVAMLKLNEESGLWEIHRSIFNRLDEEGSLNPEFWRKNL